MKLAGRILVVLVVLGLVFLYAAIGTFQVGSDEEAVILRLGRYHSTVGAGLQWHALGLDRVIQQPVTQTIEEEFGYRTIDPGPPAKYEPKPEEKRMLTGDENLLNAEFAVQYRIGNLRDYVFNLADVRAVLRDVALASMREAIAKRPIDDALTQGKGPIEFEVRARIQEIMDEYGAGVQLQNVQLLIVEPPAAVKEAFAEVTNAEQDRERLIHEAEGYAGEVLPRARGEAKALTQGAEAYRQERTLRAEGETSRFTALLQEYKKAPEVTRKRLYLETFEEILPSMDKIIVEEGQSDKILPYLPVGRRVER